VYFLAFGRGMRFTGMVWVIKDREGARNGYGTREQMESMSTVIRECN
jgi:hypothetical protein